MKRIPWPGEKLGPCLARCEHQDCRVLREAAGKLCAGCRAAIGYHAAFDAEGDYACHRECMSAAFAKLSDEVLGGRVLPSGDADKLEALRVMILRGRRAEVA